jgi:hypothetical protein
MGQNLTGKKSLVIGLDFDGTCVTHDYPEIGKDIGAVPVLKQILANGHKLMLWTMRGNKSQKERQTLSEAVDWLKENDIQLWGINNNPTQTASGWSNSHKQHANLYIDDAALGAPLKVDLELSPTPFIDWVKVEEMLKENNII